MAAARVIHFGWDDCYRVPVLRMAGFEVKEVRSLNDLRVGLQDDERLAAVIVSEDVEPTAERAAEVVRQATPAPLILFRSSQKVIDERKFDKVYSCVTSPAIWVSEMAALIAVGYRLQAESARLRAEAAAVQTESQRQRMRARLLRDPSSDHR